LEGCHIPQFSSCLLSTGYQSLYHKELCFGMNNDTVTPQIHPNSEQEVSSCSWLTLLDLKWPKHTHTPPTQHCILYTHTHTQTC